MAQPSARRTVLRAVDRGLVDPDALERLLRTPQPGGERGPSEGWGDVLAELVRQGLLDPATVASLVEDLERERRIPTPWSPLPPGDPGAGPAVAPPTASRPRHRAARKWPSGESGAVSLESERFEIVSSLGSGGMGEVFKAFDPSLDRHVAIKVLRSGGKETLERFVREARAQARIDHPNVCPVYEVGEVGTTPFIVMQYVDGQTLERAAAEMTVEQKVQVMRTVAEAVHAAHRAGLIHRDLKPSNILVERTRDGGWNPYVMDFGLVRDAEVDGLTRTGEVLGTPSYMAPEQARGELELIDRRTDVYSLGCVLYELLTGLPPFVASSSMGVLLKMLGEEAEPPRGRQPQIPTDLDTIVMKCLEKEPGRRYDSARALGEDLGRFLDGEPVLARPAGVVYRVSRKVRKHRIASALIAIASALALGSGVLAIATQVRAREQAAAARRFGEDVKAVDGIVRTAALLPLHDTTRELARVRARLARIEQEMKRLGSTSTGPGEYALGRGAMATHHFAEARTHLEAAWSAGYREPEVAYALGLTLGALYQEALDDAQRVTIKELREAKRQQAEKTLRAPALAYLHLGESAGEETPFYAEGLIAFYEGRNDQALRDARRAFDEAPWQYQAKRLEGDVLMAVADGAQEHGDDAAAEKTLAQAGEAYATALTIARSDSSLYEGEGSRWTRLMELSIRRGASPALAYARGLEACARALQASPDSVGALVRQSHLHWRYAAYLASHGGDPAGALAAALASGTRAAERDRNDPKPHLELGLAHWTAASIAYNLGRDPLPEVEGAVASFQRALELDSGEVLALNGLGMALELQGETETDHGLDPRPSLAEAMKAHRRALELKPDFALALNNLGVCYQSELYFEALHGLDGSASLAGAVNAFSRAVVVDPNFALAHSSLGNVLWTRAELEITRGEDPTPSLQAAEDAFRHAIAINGSYSGAHSNLAGVLTTRAAWSMAHGRAPVTDLRAAEEELDRATRIDPVDPTNLFRRGECALIAGRWAASQGRSPTSLYARAEAALRSGLRVSPDTADGRLLLTEVHWRRGEWLAGRHQDPRGEVRLGLEEIERALATSPDNSEAFAERGALHLLAAEWPGAGAARSDLARRALDDLEGALRATPALAHRYGKLAERARALIVR